MPVQAAGTHQERTAAAEQLARKLTVPAGGRTYAPPPSCMRVGNDLSLVVVRGEERVPEARYIGLARYRYNILSRSEI